MMTFGRPRYKIYSRDALKVKRSEHVFECGNGDRRQLTSRAYRRFILPVHAKCFWCHKWTVHIIGNNKTKDRGPVTRWRCGLCGITFYTDFHIPSDFCVKKPKYVPRPIGRPRKSVDLESVFIFRAAHSPTKCGRTSTNRLSEHAKCPNGCGLMHIYPGHNSKKPYWKCEKCNALFAVKSSLRDMDSRLHRHRKGHTTDRVVGSVTGRPLTETIPYDLSHPLLQEISNYVPVGLETEIKNEVIQSIAADILFGTVSIEYIKEKTNLNKYITKAYSYFDTRNSLYRTLGGKDSNLRLIDVIPSPPVDGD